MKWLLMLLALAVGAVVMPVVANATPPYPTFGTAVVDGQYGEWDLTADFFGNMYRAGDSTKVLEGKLYLRYDCVHNTLFALVLDEPGVVGYIDSSAVTSWIAIDAQNNKVVNENSGNDGIPPDFAWIGRGYDGNPQHVRGYEASFILLPGTYEIIAHTDIWDARTQTSATVGFPKHGLIVEPQPSGAEPASFGAIKASF